MNAGVVEPNTLMQSGGAVAARSQGSENAFAAVLDGAVSAFGGTATDGTNPAPVGTNGPQDRRVPDEAQERAARRRDSARDASRRESDASTRLIDAHGVIGLVSPDATAAAILVSPSPPSDLNQSPAAKEIAEPLNNEAAQGSGRDTTGFHATRSASARGASGAESSAVSSGASGRSGVSSASGEGAAVQGSSGLAPGGPSSSTTTGAGQQDPDNGSAAARTPTNGVPEAGAIGAAAQVAPPAGTSAAPGAGRATEAVSGVRGSGAGVGGGSLSGLNRASLAKGAGASSAQPGTSPRLAQAEDGAVAAQVARGLAQALRQRSGTMTLRLSPESLGQVRIDLSVQGKSVRATVVAASDEARERLTRDAQTLRSALESRGLKVDELQITSREQADASRPTVGANLYEGASAWTGGSSDGSAGQGTNTSSGAPQSAAGRRPNRFDASESASDLISAVATQRPVHWDGSVLRLDAVA